MALSTLKDDLDLLNSLCENEKSAFVNWLDELNHLQAQRDTNITGVKVWFDDFVDGLTPVEALDNALKNQA